MKTPSDYHYENILGVKPLEYCANCEKLTRDCDCEHLTARLVAEGLLPEKQEPEFNNVLEADAHNWDARELTEPDLRDKIFRLVVNNKCTVGSNSRDTTDQIIALLKGE